MATLNADVFANHTAITAGVLRNGPAANVSRTSRASSLATCFHFSGIRYRAALNGSRANLTSACPLQVLLEAQIRSAFHQLVVTSMADQRAANAAAGGAVAFDEVAARTAAVADPANRTNAIALGSVHTALVHSYRIAAVDIRETEVQPRVLQVIAPAAAVDEAAYFAQEQTATKGWTVALASGHAAMDATADERVILDMVALSAVEVELAYGLFSMGQASPVRAGAQLYIDAHHYHSDADGSARHRAIEKEVLSKVTDAARSIWKSNVMRLRNAVWHAGIHFVTEDLLQQMAEDGDMPARLDATGYGSMSVGLPAQEDLFSRAGSYKAVFDQTNQTATAHGHTVSLANMTATVVALMALPRRGALAALRPALPGLPPAPWPAGCDTRAKALKIFLEPALDTAEPVAAWMMGYYREIASRAGIRASSQEGSLLRSYSLKRAVANYLGEANRAQEMFLARARYIRVQAEDGNLEQFVGRA